MLSAIAAVSPGEGSTRARKSRALVKAGRARTVKSCPDTARPMMSAYANSARIVLRILGRGLGLCVLVLGPIAITAPAARGSEIANVPLFLVPGVAPNVILAIDDSGSMDSEVLLPTNDGALWWNTNTDDFIGLDNNNAASLGAINYNRAGTANGTWKKFVYLFPNGTGNGQRVYSDSNNDHYAIPPFPQYAFVRSSAYNGMYYDPAIVYEPWPDGGGYSFSNVPPTAAPSDPVKGSATFNLTIERDDTSNNRRFRIYEGMVIPEGTEYYDGSWRTAANDFRRSGEATNWGIKYRPATYYVPVTDGSAYTVENAAGASVNGNCTASGTANPAHYTLFSDRPSSFDASGRAHALAPDGVCLRRVEIAPDTEEMQNFANWFTYVRKRHIATRAGIGQAFDGQAGLRTGALTINSRSLRGMYPLAEPVEANKFFKYVYERGGNSGGTPNREALRFIGQQFDSNSNVIQEACQQNFAMLFTDGFSNVWTGSGVGNADGTMGEPFEDNHSNTIADIAAYYYNLRLRGANFERGLVPTPPACSGVGPVIEDCNADPHMVTYGITLGAQGGNIFGVTHSTIQDAYDNPPDWRNPTTTRNPVQVDDLYHAAVNSKGEMLNARSAEELRLFLGAAIQDIVERAETSATSAATSAAVLQADTLLYSASFRSEDWSGNVVALEISEVDGSVGSVRWDAESVLAASSPAARNLLTHDGAAGVALDFDALSATQKAALNRDEDGVLDNRGADRVAWLRGDDSQAGLRSRSGSGSLRLVGDIVNGTPEFVQNRSAGFQLLRSEFSPGLYPAYVGSKSTRPDILIAPSNGGMVHGFDAADGEELFAYVPGELLEAVDAGAGEDQSAVSQLSADPYEHRYTVDGTPTVSDVLIGGAWKTVLVGTMGVGGRSVFALDISDPENVSSSSVLWEFSDPDLGYGVTEVQIVPLENNVFGAVFGNGYNSDNDRSFLYVVNMADGTLIKKIDTGAGSAAAPNGMGPALVSDWPDGDFLAEYVYAGDLLGNLWRFNLASPDPDDWDNNTLRLFSAVDPSGDPQPITVQPRVATNKQRPGELMVLFGTGSFFRVVDKDLSSPQIQTLYGLRDPGASVVAPVGTRSDLIQQTISFESTTTALGSQRVVREVQPNTTRNDAINDPKGWFLDLVSPNTSPTGERVIARATFPSSSVRDRVRFTTLQFNADPCSTGRQGFVFDLNLSDGGEADQSVFDINSDGFFNTGDLVSNRQISAISGGFGEELTIIRDQEGRSDFFFDGGGNRFGSGGGGEGLTEGDPVGRQSWQQLR